MIAVFLALGLGILMGSVVLSERYVQRLEGRVEDFEDELDQRRQEVADLNDRVDVLETFAAESETRLVEGSLLGQEIVAFALYDADAEALDAVAETIDLAGGTLVSRITLTDRFGSAEETDSETLANILGSASVDAETLAAEAARAVGQRAAAAATARVVGDPVNPTAERLAALIGALEDEGYLGISTSQEVPVPAGAVFLVFGGTDAEPPAGAVALGLDLMEGLVGRERGVMAAEPTASTWDFISAVRDHESLGALVSTVDHADTVPGRVAIALGLDLAGDGVLGHYGYADGAASILPAATPGA